jgi:hypothetical protein
VNVHVPNISEVGIARLLAEKPAHITLKNSGVIPATEELVLIQKGVHDGKATTIDTTYLGGSKVDWVLVHLEKGGVWLGETETEWIRILKENPHSLRLQRPATQPYTWKDYFS